MLFFYHIFLINFFWYKNNEIMYRGNVLLVLLEKMLFFYHIFRIKFIWYKNNEKTRFSTEK